jgi:hypothetical protein
MCVYQKRRRKEGRRNKKIKIREVRKGEREGKRERGKNEGRVILEWSEIE